MSDGGHSGWAPYLRTGERILWTGAPSRRLFVFRKVDLFLIPFSLVWSAGAMAALFSGLSAGGLFLAIGVFFGVMGLYATIGRFLIDAYGRRRSTYALTDQRAFMASSAWGKSLKEQPLHVALPVSFKGGHRGSVTFGEAASIWGSAGGFGVWTGDDGSFTFRQIEEPEGVYHMAQNAKVREGAA